MKKIIICIILLIILIPNIYALNIQEPTNQITLTHNIDNIKGTNKGYITTSNTLTNTIITSYNLNNELLSQKQFELLNNININTFNNSIIVTGIKPNGYISIYFLDEYLRTINMIETTITTTDITTIKTYNYNNKIHILLTTDDFLLIDNIIYELDSTYNITNNNFANYPEQELINILKSDYYAIKNTYTNSNNENYYYKLATYNKEYNVIAGYKQDTLLNKHNIITYINSNNEFNTITLTNTIENIILINNELIVLTTDDINTNILKYDMSGNLIESYTIQNINSINTISNNLVLANYNTLNFYQYECIINILEEPYGTVTVTASPKPYDIVDINIITNSGYIIDAVKVTDIDGNNIAVENNQFTMPNKSVSIEPVYKANIVNPNTADTMFIILLFLLIATYIWKKLYKKYLWLK